MTDARCEPKSRQQPRPPIVIGGSGRIRTLAIVARHADQWDASFVPDPDRWREISGVLDDHCSRIGRDPTTITRSVHLAWNATDASEAPRRIFTSAFSKLLIYDVPVSSVLQG